MAEGEPSSQLKLCMGQVGLVEGLGAVFLGMLWTFS
jgi:hypothetical protein